MHLEWHCYIYQFTFSFIFPKENLEESIKDLKLTTKHEYNKAS